MYFITIGLALSGWYQKVFGQEVPAGLLVSKDKADAMLQSRQLSSAGLDGQPNEVLASYFHAVTGRDEEGLIVDASLSTLLSLWCDAYELDNLSDKGAAPTCVNSASNLQRWYRHTIGEALTHEWQIPVKSVVVMQETYEAGPYLKYSTKTELYALYCGLTGRQPPSELATSRGLMQEALRTFWLAFSNDRDNLQRTTFGGCGPSFVVPAASVERVTAGLQQMRLGSPNLRGEVT